MVALNKGGNYFSYLLTHKRTRERANIPMIDPKTPFHLDRGTIDPFINPPVDV